MFKRLPSRNNRSKGFRVKHVLQICLLLGVCFWLIYQVKHSHDKKKEFDKNDANTSNRKLGDDGIIKLGRKDLHPDEITTKIEKHVEEDEEEISVEEEEKHEDEEQEEEQNKHEVEEQEEEENKNEEIEEDGRGGGDDEIDENEQERKEGEGDHDEDFIDEEKEREDDEKESEDKETQVEDENSSEDQDSDGSSRNTHEAREEHYKADDASSAVTHDAHDAQIISTETEHVSSENSNEGAETNNLELQNKSRNAEEINGHEKESGLMVREGGTDGNGTLIVIAGEQKADNSSTKNVDGQVVSTLQSDGQQEGGNNSFQVGEKATNGSTVVTVEVSQNVTEEGSQMSGSSPQNETDSVSYSDHPQNVTIDGTTTGESKNSDTLLLGGTNNSSVASEDNQSSINSTISTGVDNASVASGQFLDSSNKLKPDDDVSGKISSSDGTAGVEEGYRLSVMKGNTDATQNEKSENGSESDRTDESSDSTNGTEDSIQHDPIDSSDTHISQDEKEVRTDLGTLPEIRTEGDESEEAAAE
ncbi:hypothetical protein FEM48_Zijuj09G0142900 [Ziziphus jujuba var. spinosa]|uniref:Myb-like protein X n=1 Tax=Ziziphus jujuba var. spinosa TaxID=714518 RepID=A0A978UTG6_ZIZJJ|nr:hypothetical protein FEM48_Zijuj09G0142900 [Ziziphus jujuba var. spinosa]